MLCFGEGVGLWIGIVWMLIVGGGLIALIVQGINRLARQNSKPVKRNSALDVAKERYARGEITKEEYDQFKKDFS